MTDKKIFSERLKAARELRKVSQAELGAKANIPASSISHFEAGSRKPSFESLRRLATALEVTTDFLLGAGAAMDLLPKQEQARAKEVKAEVANTKQVAEDKNQPRYVKALIPNLVIDGSLFSSGRVSELILQVKDVSIGVASYQQTFAQEAKVQEQNGHKGIADTLHVLYLVCDFWLRSEDTKNPFQPRSWIGNARSPIPNDLSEDQVFQLGVAIDHISDARMVARLADVVWTRLKKVEFARRAVNAYLQSAKDDRMMEMERFWNLERAFRLAKQIGAKELYSECVNVFKEFQKDDALYDRLNIALLSLAQFLPIMEPEDLANEARRLAQKVALEDPPSAKDLNVIAATAFRKIGNEKAAEECYRSTADSYLEISKKMDALTSSSFIEEAIEALRLAKAPKSEIQALNKLLTQRGKESLKQMKRIESEKIDFTDTVRAAKKLIEGLAPIDALVKLAFQFPILSYAEHKAEVEKSIKDHPLMYLISAKYISGGGRQYSRRSSFMSDDPEVRKEAFDTEIAASMARYIEAIVRFCLIPALRELHWTSNDFMRLYNIVANRPIVPPERAEFFFLGIKAGIEGDFLEAGHILIPQIENSLRFLLEARGLVVTSLDSENLHSEMSLNKIFEIHRKELVGMLGSEDLVYIMESFLCSKSGQNFRNELSHGLVNNSQDYRFALAWWLTVYLLFLLKFPDSSEKE